MRLNPASSRDGMTLIEVVGGLFILSTLLVAILLSFGRHERQQQRALQLSAAVRAADQLLTKWHSTGEAIPTSGDGVLSEGGYKFRWNMQPVPEAKLKEFDINFYQLRLSTASSNDRVFTIGVAVKERLRDE